MIDARGEPHSQRRTRHERNGGRERVVANARAAGTSATETRSRTIAAW